MTRAEADMRRRSEREASEPRLPPARGAGGGRVK